MGLVTTVEGEEEDITRVLGARCGLSSEEEDFVAFGVICGVRCLGETN